MLARGKPNVERGPRIDKAATMKSTSIGCALHREIEVNDGAATVASDNQPIVFACERGAKLVSDITLLRRPGNPRLIRRWLKRKLKTAA
jgi:hypothetical protein